MSAFSNSEIKKFNLDGVENFFAQLEANKQKKIKTWAIFWYKSIFKSKGLCLNPTESFVKNIGLDGSGVHCGAVPETKEVKLNERCDIHFGEQIEESKLAVNRIKYYFKSIRKSLLEKVINKVVCMLSKK